MFKLHEIIKSALAEVRKEFKGTDEEFDSRVKANSQELIAGAATTFMNRLFQFYDEKRIKQLQEAYAGFLKNHQELHKDGLEMFLMFIDLQVTVNVDMTSHFKVDRFPEDERHKFGQLLHLHIKGCQIANEIYTLINAGYSDAALARWRTLHETCVIFITLFTADPIVSRMFYDYQSIEKQKRVKTFQIHQGTLNWKAVDENTIQILEQKKAELIAKYGQDFHDEYGWAITVLPKGRRHFTALEENAGLSYLRPFYQWANKGVHAGPEGTFTRLGFDDINIPRQILAGPSRYGMADPMQFTTYSILKMTTGLMELVDNLENKLLLNVLELLHEEITKAMIEAQNKLPA